MAISGSNRIIPIGQRIAIYRRRRGLSQVGLADLMGRSESWISQIERGVKPIERLSVIEQLSRHLNILPTELMGISSQTISDSSKQHPSIHNIRLALSRFDFLKLDSNRPSTITVDDLDILQQNVEQAWITIHNSRYSEGIPLVYSLLLECEKAARNTNETLCARAHRLLAQTYHVIAALMAKHGETELARVAADRSVVAGERADIPLLPLVGVYRLAIAFLSGWQLDEAESAASSGTLALASKLNKGSPELVSLYGAMNLVHSVIASRRGNRTAAWHAIAEAEKAAATLGVDRNDFNTEFGPTNVALHAVSVAVDLGQTSEALRRAESIDPCSLSAERQARFWIDVARAYAQRRARKETVASLRKANSLAPQQLQRHPIVQEMVRDLIRRNRRAPDRDLINLARAIGIYLTT